ncbi:methyl-accepting chemotaxis protein [Burkholderia pseudomallei]|uniref:methyl-accepting chemotaxis protein n=1 Tax=Burkholderia pseudomallei TaxID=28450 RepID=UPI000F08EB80|nr:methyl-accepting chemotaxis protein [Burkholderia pseudomallei]VCM61453.1 methyl-accepting chemotaxis protein [Burkholderia pseudomallei]
MDIRRKLQVFSLVTVLSMGAGVLVCATGLRAAMKAEDASHERERTLQGITEIKASALSTIQLDPSTDDTRKIFADAERNIGKWSSTLAASLAGTPHAAPFRALIAQWGDYDRRSHALFDLAARDAKAATDRTTALYHTDFEPFQHALEQMAGEMNALAEQQNAEARGVVDSVFVTVLSVMLGGMVVVCAMIFALARSLNRGIAALQTAIERIGGSRDFTLRAPVRGRDELARTAEAFNVLIERVAAALREVWAASESASTATREIAAGNADLSARTETQAASLEESAASMAQLTATVSQNAENAKVASELAGNASGVAHTARGVVEAMVATMAEIGRHSSRIGEITALIDGIAFQTNILALNAAVEAARAGEQGRGFAVVAGEVRGLAQRAADAAREIRSLIDASVATVGAGESQAEQVRRTMAELQQGAGKVADVVDDISAASVEQSRGIAQVGQAVGHMDEVTQRNAALVEELAAASQAMAQQMQALRDAVGIFRIGGPPAQRREPGDPGCAAGALGGRAALTPAFA